MFNHSAFFLEDGRQGERGQIAVIVLLITMIITTVALSLAVRTSQEIMSSAQQYDSARVFSSAETGLDYALSKPFGSPAEAVPIEYYDTTTYVSYTTQGGSSDFSVSLNHGETLHIPLNNNPSLTFDWGVGSGCQALLLAIYNSSGVPRYQGVRPETGCEDEDNDFREVSDGPDDYLATMTLSMFGGGGSPLTFMAGDTVLRIKPMYSGTTLFVRSSTNIPTFYELIRAEASNTTGQEKRAVEVKRTIPAPPDFMDYSIYTNGTLIK